MAITNAQQAKQILMEDGGIPQLVKKGKGKKRTNWSYLIVYYKYVIK